MSGIHVAQFSKQLVVPIAEEIIRALEMQACVRLEDIPPVLYLVDPCAGIGWRLDEIVQHVNQVINDKWSSSVAWFGVEIEPAYMPDAHPNVMLGDSTDLRRSVVDGDAVFADSMWDIGVTSPTYGNGMNDNFRSKVPSKRNTYIHRIRETHPDYELHGNNTAGYGWRSGGKKWDTYIELHAEIYAEMHRVLKPDAPFIVNTKNFMTGGSMIDVTLWHHGLLSRAGFKRTRTRRVLVPGLTQGDNRDREVFESIVTYRNMK